MNLKEVLELNNNSSNEEVQATLDGMLETYRIIESTSGNEEIIALAKEKRKKLESVATQEGFKIEDAKSRNWSIDKEIEMSNLHLAKNLCDNSPSSYNSIMSLLASSGNSPERYYIQALVELRRNDFSLTGCQAAIPNLEEALRQDPNNEAVASLLEVIRSEIRIYNERLEVEAAERARLAEESARRVRQQAAAKADSDVASMLIGLGVTGFVFCLCCNCCCSGC